MSGVGAAMVKRDSGKTLLRRGDRREELRDVEG